MKMYHIVFTFIFLLAATSWSAAQDELSKKERKEWKKMLKDVSPEEYKELVEEKEEQEKEIKKLKNDVADLKKEKAELENELEDLKAVNKKKEQEQQTTQEKGSYGDYKSSTSEGVQYKVQVGAFKNLDLRDYFDNHKNFSGETEEGLMKYTLGVFSEYWEADKFKSYLRDMGVKGAWVVAYKDGKRVPMKEAREGTL